MFYSRLFLFLSLIFSNFLSAVVYKIEVFKDENNNFIHLLYDVHIDVEGLYETEKQQEELLSVIKDLDNSYLIVEDLFYLSQNQLFRFFPVKVKSEIFKCLNLWKKSHSEVPVKLEFNSQSYDKCFCIPISKKLLFKASKLGIKGFNAEFRQIVDASLAKGSNIEGEYVIKNLDRIIDTLIKNINDLNEDENFNKEYFENLKLFCSSKRDIYYSSENKLRLKLIDSKKTMHKMGIHHEDILEGNNGLCCGILEVNLIYQIYKNRSNKKNVFVCAGGHHLEVISNLLPKLGYKKVDVIEGIETENEDGSCVIINTVDIQEFYYKFRKLVRSKSKKRKLDC